MAHNVTWTGDVYAAAFKKHVDTNVTRAAVHLAGDIVSNFRGSAGEPSQQGEIPHVQTGTVKRSITNERVGFARQRVGSTLRPLPGQAASYPIYLEFGTRPSKGRFVPGIGDDNKGRRIKSGTHPGIEPRPWAKPSLSRNRRRLKIELNRPFTG